jgi:hypothetical protein
MTFTIKKLIVRDIVHDEVLNSTRMHISPSSIIATPVNPTNELFTIIKWSGVYPILIKVSKYITYVELLVLMRT